MRAHTALCMIAVMLSCIGMVLAALDAAWEWCAAFGVLDIASLMTLHASLKGAREVPPLEDRREDDPKEMIGP